MMKVRDPRRFDRLPDAILFDTDNTLYHYDPPHEAAMRAVRDKVVRSLSIDGATFDAAFGKAREIVKKRLKNAAASHSRLLYFQAMLEIMGLGTQVMLALDFEQTYWRTFLGKAVLFKDVKELLDDIRLLGIQTVVITDLTAQIQFRKIIYFELDSHFDYIITSEEAGFDKPHEAPFKLALEKMKTTGDRIWMIGDSDKDIIGAREKIGAVTLQKLHSGVHEIVGDNAPDATFTEFTQLRHLLKKLTASTGQAAE